MLQLLAIMQPIPTTAVDVGQKTIVKAVRIYKDDVEGSESAAAGGSG